RRAASVTRHVDCSGFVHIWQGGSSERRTRPIRRPMGRPRLTLLCGVILAAAAFSTPALAIDAADPLASEPTALAPVPAVTRSGPNWAAPQIATVVAAGLMGPDVPAFRPPDPPTPGHRR